MTGASKLAQLAKLRSQRQAKTKNEDIAPDPQCRDASQTKSKLAALAQARSRKNDTVQEKNQDKIIEVNQVNLVDLVELVSPVQLTNEVVEIPAQQMKINGTAPILVKYQISFDDSNLLDKPHNLVSSFLLKRVYYDNQSSNKSKRKQNRQIFHPITNHDFNIDKINQVKQSFKKPSPDDIILNVQDSAFDKKLADLSLHEKLKLSAQVDKKLAPSSIKENKKLGNSSNSSQVNLKSLKQTKPFKNIDINHELTTNPTYLKPHKSFVVIGHVDAGKSTLMGRILYDYGIVDSKTVNKLVQESERIGKGSFALAWIMDQTSEERARGVTIDICATDFETSKVRFTAIDAPGHKDFVPQMIGGVSKADIALLVVDAIEGGFESGFSLDGQTKEHTILAKNLGINKIVIAINKLDKVNWDQHRFEFIKQEMINFLTGDEVGFNLEQIDVIPISGLTGNNVVKRDDSIEEFKWYTGPTLGSYLENVELTNRQIQNTATELVDEDFLLSVHDSYRDSGSIKVNGKIISGIIQAGETIIVSPTREILQVQSIKVANKAVDFAIKGELATLSFKASQLSNDQIEAFRIGDSISKINSHIKTAKKIQVELHLFNTKKPLLVGTPFIMFRNNCQVPARITEIVEIIGGKKKKKLLHLVSKQAAIVNIEIENTSISVTKYDDNKLLGRVVIRREGNTIGAGKVLEVIE